MEILLTRHGQTEWNVLKKAQGMADILLNEKGIEQADNTKILLKDENIDLIVCSPLTRAIQTAEIINNNRNIPIVLDNRLAERDFGEFEGVSKTEFDIGTFWSYKQNIKYQKAENIRSFFKRVYGSLDEIHLKYEGKKVLIVAHAGVSRAAYCYFNGIPNEDTLLGLGLKNCEVAKYIYREK